MKKGIVKIQAVLDAEAALAAAVEANAPLYARRDALVLALDAVETELAAALPTLQAALDAALDVQAQTLPPWTSDEGRGVVRGGVAWLRPMFHAGDVWPRPRPQHADRWLWTLDFLCAGHNRRVVLDDRDPCGDGAPTLADMKVAADRVLVENSWLLLDALPVGG